MESLDNNVKIFRINLVYDKPFTTGYFINSMSIIGNNMMRYGQLKEIVIDLI